MEKRINDKIEEIEEYLQELNEIIPKNFEEYLSNLEKRLACERIFEKIVGGVIDLAFIFSRNKEYSSPREEQAIFDILEENKIISKEFARKLKDAKSMKNFIAHEYGKIDDELVFEAITENLEKDIKEFVNLIKRGLK